MPNCCSGSCDRPRCVTDPMRAHVTVATLKRLDAVKQAMNGVDGVQRGGVLLVPPIERDYDVWSERAMSHQQALQASAREDKR